MTQDELWQLKFLTEADFPTTHHRNPSKYRIEEYLMLNFIKHNCKLLNAGNMKTERVGRFNELLALGVKYRRKYQYI